MKELTIKISDELLEELKYINNQDEFIQMAIKQALEAENAKLNNKKSCFVQPDKSETESDDSADNSPKWERM